jgi:type I restriction enzyme S subunit
MCILEKSMPNTQWKRVKLGDLFDFKNGVNAEKSSYGTGTPFINVMDIFRNDILTQIDVRGKVEISNKILEENSAVYGDIFFNRTSETPEEIAFSSIYVGTEKITFGGFVIRARPTTDLLVPAYGRYCFKPAMVRKEIIRRGQGAVRGNIGQKDLQKVEITLPGAEEQKRIVEILETWDECIKIMNRKIELKKRIKKGLMQQLMTGKVRLPGFNNIWKERRLGEFFKERKETGHNDLPLLSVTSGREVTYQHHSNKKDTSNEDKSKYKRILPNDIGYNTMRMWQGRSALSKIEGIISPAYTVITPIAYKADAVFFSYLFKTERMKYLFFQKSQGIVSDTWNCKFKDFATVVYQIPEYEEQVKIGLLFTTLDHELEILTSMKSKIIQQRKYLIDNLVSGKIRTSSKPTRSNKEAQHA